MDVRSALDSILHPPPERITDSPFQSTNFAPYQDYSLMDRHIFFSFNTLKALFFCSEPFFMKSVTAAMEGSTTWDGPSVNAHGEKEELSCLFILRNWALKQDNCSDKHQVALDSSLEESLDIGW